MQPEEALEGLAAAQAVSMIVVGSPAGGITALRASDGMVIWEHPTPPIRSLVCSAEAVYLGTSTPSMVHSRPSQVMALRVRDGAVLWRTAPKDLQGRPALAVDGDRVFAVGSRENRAVFALDTQTGSVRWIAPDMRGCSYRLIAGWNAVCRRAALSDYFSLPQTRGTYQLLTAQRGAVYLTASNSSIHMLDAHTGRERWRSTMRGTPITVTVNEAQVFTEAYTPQGLVIAVLRAADGTLESTLPLQRDRDRPLIITDQGIVYLIRGPQVCALRIIDGESVWCTSHIWEKTILPGDVALQAFLSDQALSYCNVQLTPQQLTVGALDRQSGKKLWEWKSDERLARASNAVSLVGGHGQLYVATCQGLFAFRERDGHLLWHALPTTDLSFIQPALVPAESSG